VSTISIETRVLTEKITAQLIAAAGPRANKGIARALNRAGGPTRTAYLRSVRAILGLKSHPYAKAPLGDAVSRWTSTRRAHATNLAYSVVGFGNGLNAIYYQPRETPKGVSINWLGGRRIIERSFYLSGKFPRRKRSGLSHKVWQRFGEGRWGFGQKNGPGLPEGMIQPGAQRMWMVNASARLPANLIRELTAIIAGHA
jgi:hypothetical protein